MTKTININPWTPASKAAGQKVTKSSGSKPNKINTK